MQQHKAVRYLVLMVAASLATGLTGAEITVVSEVLHTPIKRAKLCAVQIVDTCSFTDEAGKFLVDTVYYSSLRFIVSAPGYLDTIISIGPEKNAPDSIVLKVQKEEYSLPKIIVSAAPSKKSPESYSESSTQFSLSDIKSTAGAVEDIGRYIGTLPSTVSSLSEGYDNTFFVRGGRPSEVTFLVDGIELENINHFSKANGSGGPIGFINSDYLEKVDFFAGNMPVSAPSRLSSIVDIRMKNGSLYESKQKLGCKLTGGMLSLEGPIAAEKSSFAVAGRYVNFQPLRSFVKEAGVPRLGDAYGKVVLMTGEDFDMSATGLLSYNTYRYEYPFEPIFSVKNTMNQCEKIVQGGAGIAARFKTGIVSNETHASFSLRNGTDADSLAMFSDPYSISHYATNPVSQDIDNRLHLTFTTFSQAPICEKGSLRFGLRFNRNKYNFSHSDESKNEGIDTMCVSGAASVIQWQHLPIRRSVSFQTLESGGHLDYCQSMGDLEAQAGMRGDYYHVLNAMTVSPRLSVSYRRSSVGAVCASFGLYHQFPIDMPTMIFDFFSSDPKIAQDTLQGIQSRFMGQLVPERCWQTSYGFDRFFGSLDMKVEGYYKWYDREYRYLGSGVPDIFKINEFGAATLQPQNGRRRVYGMEVTAQDRHDRRHFYEASGSLFDVKNQYEHDAWREDWTDVRYTYSLSAGIRPLENHLVSASVRGCGGRPLCAQTIAVDCMGRKSAVLDTSEPLFSRRLDPMLSVNMKYSFTATFGRTAVESYVEILNLCNYKPTLEYKFNGDRFIEVKPFGITPIIGCTVQL